QVLSSRLRSHDREWSRQRLHRGRLAGGGFHQLRVGRGDWRDAAHRRHPRRLSTDTCRGRIEHLVPGDWTDACSWIPGPRITIGPVPGWYRPADAADPG